MKAVLFHTHGIDKYDFSSLQQGMLPAINAAAAKRNIDLVPTLYLTPNGLDSYIRLLDEHANLSDQGLTPRILGFGIEGPLLGPNGGIPRASTWIPTVREWHKITGTPGAHPAYVVMAPDAMGLDDEIEPGYRFRDLLDSIYSSGSRVAVGHFCRDDAGRSARRLDDFLSYIWTTWRQDRFAVLTDHLYNDMPRNFKHTWRTDEERITREEYLKKFLPIEWNPDSVEGLLGPIPGRLLGYARTGMICPALNFDGEHVDLEIVRKTVAYVGAANLIAITDNTEVPIMAGERLTQRTGSHLYFRDDGAVAAGGLDVTGQVANMHLLGLSGAEIATMLEVNPRSALGLQ